MSWLQSTNIASLAKSAMKEAQKTFDSALDIQERSDMALDPTAAWGSLTGSFFDATEALKGSSERGRGGGEKAVSKTVSEPVVSTEPKSSPGPALVTTVQPSSSVGLPLIPSHKEKEEEEDAQSDSTLRGSGESSYTNVVLLASSEPKSGVEDPSERDSQGFEDCDLNDDSNSTGDPVQQGSIMTPCGPELLIQEAMIDQSEAGSSSSKSYEVVKALHSGHTSGDEMETQTSSSDIEIISNPRPSSSISSALPHGQDSCSSPNMKKEKPYSTNRSQDGHIRSGSEISIIGSDEASHSEIERLLKKIKDLNDILDARETKIVELSRLNIQLSEKNTDLASQVKEAMKINTKLSESTLAAEEFTVRLSTMEKKLQQTQTEREGLREELKMIKKGNADRKSEAEWKELLDEKDETISDLRSEGESLSKEVGKYSEHIKKLRAKDKSSEKEIKSLKSELEVKSKDLDRLKKSLKAKDDIESKQIAAIQGLTSGSTKLEKENSRLKSTADEALEKSENLRSSLENAYKEMAELKREASEREDEAQELALSKEMTAKMALQEQLRALQEQSMSEKESLYDRMDELRSSLSQGERRATLREEQLTREREGLQIRLEESENRLQELSGTLSATTLPLQRQIESLQFSLREAQSCGEKVEASLQERLQYANIQLAAATEKDRSVSEQLLSISGEHSTLEVKYHELFKRSELESKDLGDCRQRLLTLEDSKKRELSSLLDKNSSLSQELSECRKETELHQAVFRNERTKFETKIKHLEGVYAEKDSRIKELQQVLDRTNMERLSYRSISPSQLSSVSETWGGEDFMDGRLRYNQNNNNNIHSNNSSFYDSVRVGGSSLASLVENYQFSLKQKDGEVSQLQGEVSSLERIRDSITSELSDLSLKAEKLTEVEEEVKHLKTLYKETEEKYQTMLTMYGEKVEETEELKLDLQDVKDMYKIQIQELLQSQKNG